MKTIALLSILSFSLNTLAVSHFNMGEYDVSTTAAYATLLRTDACARAAVDSVKGELNEQAMQDGVDIPDLVDLSYLEEISAGTYSLTLNDLQRLVKTKRAGKTCRASAPYKASTKGTVTLDQITDVYGKVYDESSYHPENFTIRKTGTQKLNNPCGTVALATLEGTFAIMAMNNGADLPETIYVDKVNYLQNLAIFIIQSGDGIYSIHAAEKNGVCQGRLIGEDPLPKN